MATTDASIKTFLWFDTEADEAATFYAKTFGGEVTSSHKYSETHGGDASRAGKVMLASFTIRGHEFMCLNGGPQHKPTPAVSFSVACDTQEELDRYWDAILAYGGKEGRCGWIEDKWGFNWQIVPSEMGKFMGGNPKTSGAVTQAMFKMNRLDIKTLRDAHEGKEAT